MEKPVLRLFPPPHEELPLKGLYLSHRLHLQGSQGRPLVYTNFATSLDGRIALPDPKRGIHRIPKPVANARDWRLFQELAAQADLLLTSGRYFRDLASGQAQSSVPVSDDPRHTDLLHWRAAHGLSPQPAVGVLSASLDVPLPPSLHQEGRPVYIFTGAAADKSRVRTLERQGAKVLYTGNGSRVDGRALMHALERLGLRSVYSIAGPEVLHTLLAADAVDRLYLTFTHLLLGDEGFDTLVTGPRLTPPVSLRLASLYFDPHAPPGTGQSLAVFECR